MENNLTQQELVHFDNMSQEQFTSVIVEMIHTNREIQQAILNLVCRCPNVVTEL